MQFCICVIINNALHLLAVNNKSDGLRQRKRHETREKLELAAIALVAQGGLDCATIEAISEKADVSARTFFNYFDSKEDALLGLHNIELSESAENDCVKRHSGGGMAETVTGIMIGLVGPSLASPELYKTRRQLIKQYPYLLERQMNRMASMNKRLTKVVQRVAQSSGSAPLSENEAEILLALCSSSVRVTIREWIETGKKVSLPKLEQQAIQKLTEVLKKI